MLESAEKHNKAEIEKQASRGKRREIERKVVRKGLVEGESCGIAKKIKHHKQRQLSGTFLHRTSATV